jgi:hypothetical protein
VQDVKPFPLDTLPSALAAFISDAAVAIACPPDYLALPMLAIAGSAIGATRAFEVKRGWLERPCLYSAVVAPPGGGKTPAVKQVAKPVYDEQERRNANYRRRKLAFEESGEKGEKPKPDIVYVADTTVEALARVLQNSQRGVGLIRDELTALVSAMDQYRAKGRGSDRQFYLAAWAGEPVAVNRKQDDEQLFIGHPFVGITGCIPPDLLSRLRGEKAIADGFIDRFLFAYPEPPPAIGETWAAVPDEASRAWQDALMFLWALEQEQDSEGNPRPRIVRMDADGRRVWKAFTDRLAEEMNADHFSECLVGPWAKFRGYCARLALIIHFLRLSTGETDREEIDATSLSKAVKLVGYFQSHTRKVYCEMQADPEIKDAERILKWIIREGGTPFKRWHVHKDIRNQARFPRVEDLDRPLDRLVKHRYIRAQPEKDNNRGRPADATYEVNPLWNHREYRVNRAKAYPGCISPDIPDLPDGSRVDHHERR